ncbi:MAG: hypothetical protein ACOH2R_08490 [Pseudomonas sp.]
MSEKKPPDWPAIEAEFRAGQLSNRMLGEKHGVGESLIRKKAKQGEWTKDLTDKVRQEVRTQLVRSAVRTSNASEREIIEQAGITGAEVVRTHRRDVRRASDLVGLLMGQLTSAAGIRADLEATVEELCKDDETGQREARLMKAISLPTHAGTIRDLSTALKNLVTLERQAHNLDELSSEETYEDRLARLMGAKE